MTRDDNTQRWEKHKELIIFLYYRNDLGKIVKLMRDSCGFDAKKREYTYRLGLWGVWKNASPAKNAAPRPRGPFSDTDELHLCLFAPHSFGTYWDKVESMGDGEQDIGLLLCCARAIGTETQAQVLAGHIGRRLEKFGDEEEVRSLLHILRGYALRHFGQSTPDVDRAVEQSVHSIRNNCCDDQAGSERKTQYVIDIPRLMLFRYGMEVSGIHQEDLLKNLYRYHLSRLSTPGSDLTECERIVKSCLAWCLPKLRSASARRFSSDILEVDCCGVDGGPARKATAYVFIFLLRQYVGEPDVTDALARAVERASVNQSLQISVCDLLYTLSALILAGPTDAPRLLFDHLCTSPADLMEAAAQRAEALPTGQCLLVFFLNSYAGLTLPASRSFGEQRFMREVCARAERLVLSVDSEFVEESMFASAVDGVMDDELLGGAMVDAYV